MHSWPCRKFDTREGTHSKIVMKVGGQPLWGLPPLHIQFSPCSHVVANEMKLNVKSDGIESVLEWFQDQLIL